MECQLTSAAAAAPFPSYHDAIQAPLPAAKGGQGMGPLLANPGKQTGTGGAPASRHCEEALEFGAHRVVTRPIAMDELLNLVDEL